MRPESNHLAQQQTWPVPADLAQYPFLTALSLDPRPTYVVDLQHDSRDDRLIFCNPALEDKPGLFEQVTRGTGGSDVNHAQWTSFTVDSRWKVIAANVIPPNTASATASTARPRSHTNNVAPAKLSNSVTESSYLGSRKLTSADNAPSPQQSHATGMVESTRQFAPARPARIQGSSTYAEFFRTFDWASTEIGAIEGWPQQLLDMCNLILASPDPIGIYWGDTAIVLYNEPIVTTIGDRHPGALGQRMENVFPEVWANGFKPLFENIMDRRQPWIQYNDRRVGYNNGRLEEVFWNVTLKPIVDIGDTVRGTWGTLYDITTQEFWQRRIATLLRLTASMNASESFDAMWSAFINGFEPRDRDVPHLLVYAASADPTISSGSQSHTVYGLKNCFGYNAVTAPYKELDTTDGAHPLALLFRRALLADGPMCFDRADVSLSEEFWNAFQTDDPDDECKTIVIVSIRPFQTKEALAYLIIGVNPFVRYDQGYREFVNLARGQVSSKMASLLLREEDVRRERLVAKEASAQLTLWKAEAEMHELRFTRLAETAPIGICTYAVDGSLTYANDVYKDIFGISHDDDASGADWWAYLVHPEDLENAKVMFGRLLIQRQEVAFEIRVRGNPNYKATPGPDGYVWVLVSAYAEPTGDGPQTVIACFTDINERKRAEEHQAKRLEDMINAKRQQEAFIDMTSHEIRNPLSVVLHCGEETISTCTALRSQVRGEHVLVHTEVLENILDAAETIVFCTLHQKRIVDDILTLSKLESDLLPVTPDNIQPLTIINGIMKLFEREIRKSDMKMSVSIHPTFHEYELDHVMLDPSRISQIIINLISNAIKFTKTQEDRQLDILIGGSINDDPPSSEWPVTYLPRQQPVQPNLFSAYWNAQESAHLHFAVLDTGTGMSADEQQKIFSRFTQASTRTHVNYGGSGLGLYICRALSETHGGQIGCESVPGKGSAFGFQVEVGRRPSQSTTTSDLHQGIRPVQSGNRSNRGPVDAIPQNLRGLTSSPVNRARSDMSEDSQCQGAFHILIVEDNVLNQKVLRRQLEKAGHTVAVAHHGLDALDQLQKTRSWVGSVDGDPPFDFVLMDVEMPVMNGLVCTQRIREYEQQGLMVGHVPIIATTGNARDEHTGQAMSAGMDQVVLKPYSLSVLLSIAQQLRQRYGTSQTA